MKTVEGTSALDRDLESWFALLHLSVPGPFAELGEVRQAGGKRIIAFAVQADFDAAQIVSNTVKLEWPPRTGRWTEFPEIDRAAWFSLEAAAVKINPAQSEFLARVDRAFKHTTEVPP